MAEIIEVPTSREARDGPVRDPDLFAAEKEQGEFEAEWKELGRSWRRTGGRTSWRASGRR